MAAAAPYLLAIGGTVLKNQADQQQAQEKRTQLNAALMRTDQTQQKANSMIGQEADKLSPVARAAAMSQQVAANQAGTTSDLATAGATDSGGNAIINTAGDNGAVSGEFLRTKADRALSEGSRLTAIAQQLAKVRAPGQLEEQEGRGRANLTEALANMWGSTQNLNRADATTADGIELPQYAALGDVAQAAGGAVAARKRGAPVVSYGGGNGAPPAGFGWKNGTGGL